MTNTAPTPIERFAASSGLVTLLAALAGVIVIALEILGTDTALYTAEIVIGGLLMAIGLRELGARLHVGRQTRELRGRMVESEKKNRLLKLTEATTQVGHWRLDLKSNQVFWSDGTFAIHGLETGATPSLNKAIEFFHPDDRSIVADSIEATRKTGNPCAFQARLIRVDGETRHTEATSQVELDASGAPIALFGVFRDRTDEEVLQQELREARDEARALTAAKSAFLAKMSHEIRTPMNGVLGFADLLKTSELCPLQQNHVDLIVESGQTLQALLDDILDLSKIETGHVAVDLQPTDIGHLINQIAQLTGPLARAKAIKIEHVVDSALPTIVMIDALRLRQITTNLMQNAVRFTENGKIRLSALRRDGQIEVQVADTGTGIPADMQEHIFSAFTQVVGPEQPDRGGTGLGLTICRQLAELMHGTLSVQSIPGKGSAFTLTLPLIEASAPPPAIAVPQTAAPTSNLAGRRVLLAEDFDINRELLKQMTAKLGIALEFAEDGVQAVKMVEANEASGVPYELVLMDMRMPNMDGLEATRTLRLRGFTPADLPIIALTANAFDDDVEACLNAGMQEHLGKPIAFETLRVALERWLPDDRKQAA